MLTKTEALAGLRALLVTLDKYDPDQPRVPAGSPDGGRWTAEGGAGAAQWPTSPTGGGVLFPTPAGVFAKPIPGSTKQVLVSSMRTTEAIFNLPTPGEKVLAAVHGPEDADEQMMHTEYARALAAVPEPFRSEARSLPFGFVDSRLFQIGDPSSPPIAQLDQAQPYFVAVYSVSDVTEGAPPAALAMDPYAVKTEVGSLPPRVKASDLVSAVLHHELGHFLDNKLGQKLYDDAKRKGTLSPELLANPNVRRQAMYSEVSGLMAGHLKMGMMKDQITSMVTRGAEIPRQLGTLQSPPEAFADVVSYLQGAKVLRGIPRRVFGQVFANTIDAVKQTLEQAEGITFSPPSTRRRTTKVQKSGTMPEHHFGASLQPYEVETRRTLPDGTVRVDVARRGPWGLSDGVRYERADGSPVRKYDPDQPREPAGSEEGGRWTDASGTSAVATGAKELMPRGDKASRQLMTSITTMSIPDRRKAFEGTDAEGRRKLEQLADPANTIGRLMKSHVPNAGDWAEDEHENFSVAVAGRIDRWIKDGVLANDTGETLKRFAVDLHTDLIKAGSDKATALRLSRHVTDIMAAQEVEALGRTLGDHGIRHLTQDAVMALDVLKALPGVHENDPAQRAAVRIAAAFHDAGYLTPPARVFLDKYHPEWGETYYKAHVAADVQRALGSSVSALVQRTIRTHADTDFDWKQEPVESAFRTADNLALFQHEKLPALLRYVPANVRVAEALGKGTLSEVEARRQAAANVAAAGLPARLSRQLTKSAGELTTIFPKLTLGMYGGRYEGVRWTGDALQINLRRATSESAFLQRISDLHSRQFKKFAESYLGEKHPALTDATTGRDFEIVSRRSKSRMRVSFLGTNVTKLLDAIHDLFAGLR